MLRVLASSLPLCVARLAKLHAAKNLYCWASISMVCTGFHVWCTFLPKNSMCGAQLCAHSPNPHPIAPPPHPTPPHPRFSAPELLQKQLLSCPLHLQHLLPSLHYRPLEFPRIEEHCSWSSSTIPLVNLFNSSTRASFFVHMIRSVHASYFVLCEPFSTTQGPK